MGIDAGRFSFAIYDGQGCTLVGSKFEAEDGGMCGSSIKEGLEGFLGAGNKYQVVSVCQTREQGIVVVKGFVLWEGRSFLFHCADDQFDC